MMIKLVNPDCDAATTCRIYELQDGEIILSIEYETIDSISFVGLSEPMSVEAAITAIKNNALAEIKNKRRRGRNPQPPDETLCGAHRNRRRRPGNLLVFSEYEREDPQEVRGSI